MAIANMLFNSIFRGGFAYILKNRWAIGNGFFTFPWLKAIAQSMHITVTANTGIAEQVPGAAHGLA